MASRPAHRRMRTTRLIAGSAAVLAALGFGPSTAAAQDFLLGPPNITLGIHGGFNSARAGSQVFDFTEDNFTVGSGDFDSGAIRAELAIRLTERLDLSIDVARMSTEVDSESRDFIGTDDLPIVQTTGLTQTPVSANLKYFLLDRGQSVGSIAWIPAKFVPYVGLGAGVVRYSFEQFGEFVDLDTFDIVNASFPSEGTGRLVQLLGGVEYSIARNTIVVLDGRYRLSSAEMRGAWVSSPDPSERFDDIDLSGFSFSLGLAVRF